MKARQEENRKEDELRKRQMEYRIRQKNKKADDFGRMTAQAGALHSPVLRIRCADGRDGG